MGAFSLLVSYLYVDPSFFFSFGTYLSRLSGERGVFSRVVQGSEAHAEYTGTSGSGFWPGVVLLQSHMEKTGR